MHKNNCYTAKSLSSSRMNFLRFHWFDHMRLFDTTISGSKHPVIDISSKFFYENVSATSPQVSAFMTAPNLAIILGSASNDRVNSLIGWQHERSNPPSSMERTGTPKFHASKSPEHPLHGLADVHSSSTTLSSSSVSSRNCSTNSQEDKTNSLRLLARDKIMPTLAAICVPCQNLLRYFPFLRKQTVPPYSNSQVNYVGDLTFVYHSNLCSIQSSADLGCSFCAQIARSNVNQKLHEDANWTLVSLQFFPISTISWTMMLLFSAAGKTPGQTSINPYMDLRVKLVPAPRPSECYLFRENNGYGLIYIIVSSTSQHLTPFHSTSRSFHQAKSWLHRCLNNHQSCESVKENRYPTRLVSTDISKTRLVLGSQISGSSMYATLSHCWGDARFVTLQQSNIEGFKDEIPANALSKTFREAIQIARGLGFQS